MTDTQKKNLETNFALSGEGESIFLFSPEGTLLDKLQIGRGHRDVSVGRDNTGTMMYYASPTPGAANGSGSRGYATEPAFAVKSGVYTSAQSVAIEVPAGCTVRYTLDGSVPTETSQLYASPISVSTNTVLRARAFCAGLEPSDTATASYLINTGAETMENHETDFAIVSIAIEPDYMFGVTNGIYVAGQRFSEKSEIETDPTSYTIDVSARDTNLWAYANFNAQHITHPDPMGLEWERPMHMDLIDENGVLEYEEDAMIRIFGAYSRYEQQKGMAIVTRSGYGTTALTNQFFENRDYTSYQSLTLRPSAMDWKMSKIRDILIQGLLEEGGSILPTQAYRRAIVYINGRYWGIYNIREKVNKHFLAAKYNIDPESIDILVGNGTTEAAQISGTNAYLDYKKLIEWVGQNDLSDPSNYAYIQSQIDIENFAEYCAMEIFVGNTDTGNIKFWRSRDYDNKWRWIPYDFDWAFNRNDGDSEAVTSGYRRNFFEKYFHEKGHGVGKGFSTVLSRGLLRNAEFRALFLQKCALMYNEIFTTEKLLSRISELEAEMLTEVKYDTDRWSDFSMKNWERSIENLKDSAENAPEYFLKYCQS
ncbi:MAG: CotH kinase family protein, partial [Alistipes sp.]|nr:CotH kinase family protein [Alistipes sp.]